MSTSRRGFVSHVHAEAPLALALKEVLEAAVPDLEVWVSEQDIDIGKPWLEKLSAAMRDATDVLVLCSSRSLKSLWVSFEAGAGFGAGDAVIPVCHSDLTIAALPDPLRILQGRQLATAHDLGALVTALGGSLTASSLDAAWQKIETALGAIDDAPAAVRPLAPPSTPSGILVDLAHGQRKWPQTRPRTVFTWSTDDLVDGAPAVEVGAIEAPDQLRAADLRHWQGLVLAMPYHARLAAGAIDQIVTWVHRGGRLALLGYELGDLHHESNLAELAGRFALRFNGDIVAPPGWTGRGKPYGNDIALTPSPGHPLFDGVGALRWRNVQTIAREPGTFPLLAIGANTVSLPEPESVGFDDVRLTMPNPSFDVVHVDPGVPVVAAATPHLTGRGGVVAIGTWDIVPDGVDEPGNRRFAANLLRWLSGT
jgi:hypothetical protein